MIPERLSVPQAGVWQDVSVVRPVDGQWSPVVGGSGGGHTPPPFTPDQGPVRNVAGGLAQAGAGVSFGTTGHAAHTTHTMSANAEQIVLAWQIRTNNMTATTATTELRCRVRSASNNWQDVTFSGQPSVSIPPATNAVDITSDPVTGTWHAGEPITVMAWTRTTGAGTGAAANGNTRSGVDPGVIPNVTWEQALTAVPQGGVGGGLRPTFILAPTKAPSSWVGIGDSISAGSYEAHMDRAARLRGLPYSRAARGGEGRGNLSGTNSAGFTERLGAALTAGYTDSVMDAYGINDAYGDTTGATCIQHAVTVWTKAKAAGAKRIVPITLLPVTSSTDGWATLTGQTPDPGRVHRIPYNRWLRDGAPILNGAPAPTGTTDPAAVRATRIRADGTIVQGSTAHPLGLGWITDAAAVTESSQDSGLWRIDIDMVDNDGLHPNANAMVAVGDRLARDLQLMGF